MTPDPMNDLLQAAASWNTMDRPKDHKDAVAWVKGAFKRLNDNRDFEAGTDTTAFLLDHTYDLAIFDPDQYISLAEKDPVWFKGLKFVTAEILKRSDPLPPQLARWVADVLVGTTRAPKKAAGRKLATVHQAAIRIAVFQLVQWKWTKTRNDASPAMSACDVVAEATGLSFDRVKDVVEKPLVRPPYLLRKWDYGRTRKIIGIDPP